MHRVRGELHVEGAPVVWERRAFCVSVTRAKDELHLMYPSIRLNAGYGEMLQRPSRFLGELPREFLEEWQINPAF